MPFRAPLYVVIKLENRWKSWEISPRPQHLLPIILKITGSEGRIQLPTARRWLFLHFSPTATFGKYLAEAITIHCAERVTTLYYEDFCYKRPFTSWPFTNAPVSLYSGFSCLLCMLLPSHTNTTLLDKAIASAIWQYANTQCPFTIPANLQFTLGWHGNDTIILIGTVTRKICAHC